VNAVILVLLIAGAVLFAIAAFGVASRINLVAAGLFCWIVATLLPVVAAL
jgi:hypothetical protein